MDSRTVISSALEARGITQAGLADKIGQSPQAVGQKLNRRSLRADEFLEIMECLDYDVKYIDRTTGKEIMIIGNGHGRRKKGIADKIVYDTALSTALANTFYADGVNEFDQDGKASELYIDQKGRYFLVNYSCIRGTKDKIVSISKEDAEKYINENNK